MLGLWDMSSLPAPRPHRWTRDSYEKLLDSGALGPEDRVQLIDGDILERSPEKSRHAATVELVAEALRGVFSAGYAVRVQHPLALSARSEPEPDVAVVLGSHRDYLDRHPETALLVVEVADSSLQLDQGPKLRLYAEVGIPTYWIVNLQQNVIEVYESPAGGLYRIRRLFQEGEVPVSTRTVAVADIIA